MEGTEEIFTGDTLIYVIPAIVIGLVFFIFGVSVRKTSEPPSFSTIETASSKKKNKKKPQKKSGTEIQIGDTTTSISDVTKTNVSQESPDSAKAVTSSKSSRSKVSDSTPSTKEKKKSKENKEGKGMAALKKDDGEWTEVKSKEVKQKKNGKNEADSALPKLPSPVMMDLTFPVSLPSTLPSATLSIKPVINMVGPKEKISLDDNEISRGSSPASEVSGATGGSLSDGWVAVSDVPDNSNDIDSTTKTKKSKKNKSKKEKMDPVSVESQKSIPSVPSNNKLPESISVPSKLSKSISDSGKQPDLTSGKLPDHTSGSGKLSDSTSDKKLPLSVKAGGIFQEWQSALKEASGSRLESKDASASKKAPQNDALIEPAFDELQDSWPKEVSKKISRKKKARRDV